MPTGKLEYPRSTRKFSFQQELSKGKKGEQWLLHHYHSPLLPYAAYDFDFLRADGKAVELKTDWYSLSGTEFFFMERWSDIERKKPGGPWQSAGKGADLFIYLFIRDGVYFEFEDVRELRDRLNSLTRSLELIRIRNRGYEGGGYKVPIAKLADLFVDYRLFWSVDEIGE